jgi:hypothetical protein
MTPRRRSVDTAGHASVDHLGGGARDASLGSRSGHGGWRRYAG